jgi:dipeptidyl aminopeptidase/acylaminoacyl peptidase
MSHTSGETVASLLPHEFSARSLVHEYGGGEFFLGAESLYFVNHQDQRLYRLSADNHPLPLTPKPSRSHALRYADGTVHPGGDWLAIVEEDHDNPEAVENRLVALSPKELSATSLLMDGHDFFASPRFSPKGDKLCWLAWDLPRMPWQGTELWVADVADKRRLADPKRVAGGRRESIFQPEWGPDGNLYFVSDRSGWWNLYRWNGHATEPLLPMKAEFGSPAWVFGLSRYDFTSGGRIACIYSLQGMDHLGLLDPDEKQLERIETPFSAFYPAHLRSDGKLGIWFIASSPTSTQALYRMDVGSGKLSRVYPSHEDEIDPALISRPRPVKSNSDTGAKIHAFFYPPVNPTHNGLQAEKPPLIVTMHGGPTGRAYAQLHWETQFWTSRGFAVADVNYRGSTGYGRNYRESLDGHWGVSDVEDCVSIALALAREDLVDRRRLIIRGGSAGGFTALAAVMFHDAFSAAGVYYAVTDLIQLAQHTHKFESRYLDSLIGPLPEAEEIYKQRSPIHNANLLDTPIIIFHGEEDPIVPPEQARGLTESLNRSHTPHAYLEFGGEQHGFNRLENVVRAMTAELFFYSRVLGFPLGEDIDPIAIPHLRGEATDDTA